MTVSVRFYKKVLVFYGSLIPFGLRTKSIHIRFSFYSKTLVWSLLLPKRGINLGILSLWL